MASDDQMLSVPVGYRRMISWELSEVKERVKKKKKRKKSQVDYSSLDTELKTEDLTSSEEGEGLEEFYSAPESPLSSDDTSTSDPTLLSPTSSLTSSLGLPEAVRKKGAQSKKKKKKRKTQNRKIARGRVLQTNL